MSTVIVCGPTERAPEPPEHLSDEGKRAWADRWRYHNEDGNYRSTVGIEDDEGNRYCVGCWWCEGPITDAHVPFFTSIDAQRWYRERRQAHASHALAEEGGSDA